MSSLRAAVLVFVIGASITNYFFTREQNDEIAPSVATLRLRPLKAVTCTRQRLIQRN